MEKSQSRRHHGADSPHLLRSKSGSTAATSSLAKTTSSKYSKSSKEISAKKTKKKQPAESDGGGGGGGLVMFLPRSTSKTEAPRRTRSAATSPSAWALSPGRSLPFRSPEVAAAAKSPASFDKKLMKKEGKGVGGVLKYFRQKKVSPLLEEEYHQYRVVYNRLLQWRYANARAEASMAAIKRVAQEKILNVWLRISIRRKIRVEKQCEKEKMKREKKLNEIVMPEMRMLNEWRLIEAKNVEALGRVLRKLSAISHSLPLLQNAKADTMSVYDAISTAVEVMDDITTMIMDMNSKVEKTCFLLTELSVILKQHKQFFEQLEKPLTLLASLEVEEKSLRVHHIQLLKQANGKVYSKCL